MIPLPLLSNRRLAALAAILTGVSGGTTHLGAQGFIPEEAARRMAVAEGLEVQLVASEPMIAQPVCIEFDDRGRLWVIQYLQYPNPAGLNRAKVDRWSRTIYDRVPDPPPRGPKGADRITILEDPDGDGRADAAHDFVSGLNLASGLAFGHGGVFVLNVPYLLFYPDRNGDDRPDGDPEVRLTGFGMEDAHSVANSLTWGPDGWLYGCQGSTVTSRIRGLEFQQGVWRYHPLMGAFELFCEGGGNSWGLDFDARGELIYSTNLGPYRNLHGVQGAYYWKSVGKHGALHNPYAFGYFDHIPHTNFTGGHVTDGGIIYLGTNLPPKFRHRYLAGDLLGHGVQWHELYPWGSTFTSSHGGYLLSARDTWFAPTDLTMAPDNSIYIADWQDQRTAHPDPDAAWDRSNGRVYRLAARGTKPVRVPDFKQLSSTELVGLLDDSNIWIARKARRVLADRRDPEVILGLRSQVLETKAKALESLWALYVSGGFSDAFAAKLLAHGNAAVRQWTVRLLGDEPQVARDLADQMADLAAKETNVSVRAQLAATAKRLPARDSLRLAATLVRRDSDAADAYLPLLLWWAVEPHAVLAQTEVEVLFATPPAWQSALARDIIIPRLMRRWAAEATAATYDGCARLLESARDEGARQRLIAALEQGFHDRPTAPVGFGSGGLFANSAAAELPPMRGQTLKPGLLSPKLAEQLQRLWREDTTNAPLIRVAARTGQASGRERARALSATRGVPDDLRVDLIGLLGELARPEDAAVLLGLIGAESEPVQLAALDALRLFDFAGLPAALLARYNQLHDRVRSRVRDVLLSRGLWARAVLGEVRAGRLPAREFGVEQLRMVARHQDKELDDLVRKHWGHIRIGTAEEKLAEMRRLNNDLNGGPGDQARGQGLFVRACALCHTLFGEGGKAGPDLTHVQRNNREYLLASIVDPSAVIRKEYLAYDAETADGRVLTGVIVEQSGGKLVLALAGGERVTLQRAQVAALRESALSLMPENLLKSFQPQEVRDLFCYLQSTDSPSSTKP